MAPGCMTPYGARPYHCGFLDGQSASSPDDTPCLRLSTYRKSSRTTACYRNKLIQRHVYIIRREGYVYVGPHDDLTFCLFPSPVRVSLEVMNVFRRSGTTAESEGQDEGTLNEMGYEQELRRGEYLVDLAFTTQQMFSP